MKKEDLNLLLGECKAKKINKIVNCGLKEYSLLDVYGNKIKDTQIIELAKILGIELMSIENNNTILYYQFNMYKTSGFYFHQGDLKDSYPLEFSFAGINKILKVAYSIYYFRN
ncbi:MAG: hypothetical protein K1X55_12675 [Chitinophagales bacterium]|nr:hypothetical protein [Chitinophagales bacterium]